MRLDDRRGLATFTVGFGIATVGSGIFAALALLAGSRAWFVAALLLQLVAMVFTMFGIYAWYGVGPRHVSAGDRQGD